MACEHPPAKAHGEIEMAKTTKVAASKTSDPEREWNRYTRAARVLAKDDKIDVATLADRAFMSESTAARCVETWHAVIGGVARGRQVARSAERRGRDEESDAEA